MEAAIYSILSNAATVASLVGTRIFPDIAEQGAALPLIVYQRISTAKENTLEDGDGTEHPRYQFSCYAANTAGRKALGDAVKAALADYNGTVAGIAIQTASVLDGGTDTWEEGPPAVYRRDIDIEIWQG